ncbi:MAG: FAD-dependent oxidoreductase [bacterium]|nr:FAD-dependent oxidoreductase [bacterium]
MYNTTLIGRRKVAANTLEISIKRPTDFLFEPGQYIQLKIPKLSYSDYDGASRVLSIASSPLDEESISLAFRDTNSGFKRTIRELPMNSQIIIEGPHGFLVLPEDPGCSVFFIAGGIGITPYLSMIQYALERGFTSSMTLIYANRDKESAAYLDQLQTLAKRYSSFSLKTVFGKIDELYIQQNINSTEGAKWFVAGPPAMVSHVHGTLVSLGIDDANICLEEFTGYE